MARKPEREYSTAKEAQLGAMLNETGYSLTEVGRALAPTVNEESRANYPGFRKGGKVKKVVKKKKARR